LSIFAVNQAADEKAISIPWRKRIASWIVEQDRPFCGGGRGSLLPDSKKHF